MASALALPALGLAKDTSVLQYVLYDCEGIWQFFAYRLAGAGLASEPLKQPLLRHLERAFTPQSARAVESALQQVTQDLVREEEAQLHQMPPALAALQRGELHQISYLHSMHRKAMLICRDFLRQSASLLVSAVSFALSCLHT